MWVILKYKIKEFKILKQNLIKKLGENVKFYMPKIKCQKFKNNKFETYEKFVLGDYMFCYHNKFKDQKNFNELRNTKGLKYFLENSIGNQAEIDDFISKCKENEIDGYLTQSFFDIINYKKAVFISGPFTNMIFKIINQQNNIINILLGNFKMSVSKKDYLFRPA